MSTKSVASGPFPPCPPLPAAAPPAGALALALADAPAPAPAPAPAVALADGLAAPPPLFCPCGVRLVSGLPRAGGETVEPAGNLSADAADLQLDPVDDHRAVVLQRAEDGVLDEARVPRLRVPGGGEPLVGGGDLLVERRQLSVDLAPRLVRNAGQLLTDVRTGDGRDLCGGGLGGVVSRVALVRRGVEIRPDQPTPTDRERCRRGNGANRQRRTAFSNVASHGTPLTSLRGSEAPDRSEAAPFHTQEGREVFRSLERNLELCEINSGTMGSEAREFTGVDLSIQV